MPKLLGHCTESHVVQWPRVGKKGKSPQTLFKPKKLDHIMSSLKENKFVKACERCFIEALQR
jgi:uncharacterized protein YlbG (UPF0298 family)